MTQFFVAYALAGAVIAAFSVWITNQKTPPTRGEVLKQFVIWAALSPLVVALMMICLPFWGAWRLMVGTPVQRGLSAWFRTPLWEKSE